MSIFKPNLMKVKLGHWCQIIFSNSAIDNFVAYDHLKKIRHFNNRSIFMEECYTNLRVAELKKQGVPILDMTLGQSVPRESVYVPESYGILSSIQFQRRMRE